MLKNQTYIQNIKNKAKVKRRWITWIKLIIPVNGGKVDVNNSIPWIDEKSLALRRRTSKSWDFYRSHLNDDRKYIVISRCTYPSTTISEDTNILNKAVKSCQDIDSAFKIPGWWWEEKIEESILKISC